MAAHRFWRVKFDSSGGGNCCAASEIEFRAAPNGVDVTGSGTAIASSIFSGSTPASNAFDGGVGESSMWHDNCTDHTNAYIGYDFGAGNEQDIVQFVFQARDFYGARDSIRTGGLDWSDDGVAWTRSFSIPTQTDFINIERRTFGKPPSPPLSDAGGHRYWRARMTPAGNPGADFEGVGGLQFSRQGSITSFFGRALSAGSVQAGSADNVLHFPGRVFGIQWGGSAAVQWCGYDFGEGQAPLIDTVTLWPNSDDPGRTWTEFAIDYSDDGTDWVEAAIVDPDAWVAATPQTFTFGEVVEPAPRRRLIVVT